MDLGPPAFLLCTHSKTRDSQGVSASLKEAREFERAGIREPITLLMFGQRYRGIITRIGGGGIYVETDAPAERSYPVLMRFRLACFDKPMTFKGAVRWVSEPRTQANGSHRPGGVGIMFQDMAPRIRRQIVEFVADSGDVVYEVSSLLGQDDTDIREIQTLLAKVNLDQISSIAELKKHIEREMDNYFDRA